jgi:hypothetical protein
VLATLAGAGLAATLAAGSASAQTVLPPAPNVTPGSAVVGTTQVLFYTATNGSVEMKNLSSGAYTAAGGRLTSGPSAIADGASLIVFGRGTDNQLWMNACNLFGSCGSWLPLGGTITSQPGAVFQGPNAADYSVYARGTNGAVWSRSRTTAGWGAWHSLGGNLLAGTGPSAAYLGGTYVLATGIDRHLYIERAGVTGFVPAGGQTTASPALVAVPGADGQQDALVGFARGTDNAGYYHRFLSSSPGWHGMGGRLTSGLAASSYVGAAIPTTVTFGLGADNHVYRDGATWASYPPGLNGWHLVG